jgi:hypothetical protein
MKKQNYEAPVTELIVVRFEQSLLNVVSGQSSATAPDNMNVWNEQEI